MKTVISVGLALLMAIGCAKRAAVVKPSPSLQEEQVSARPAPPPVPAPSRPGAPSEPVPGPAPGVEAQAAPGRPGVREEAAAVPSRPTEIVKREITPPVLSAPALGPKDIFFDFDRALIREDDRDALAAAAKLLAANPGLTIQIEGHADERGSVDYNLVLGEKRARAAREYLVTLGAKADRLSTISYGKQRPFCREQTEDCYQQNRRAHFAASR